MTWILSVCFFNLTPVNVKLGKTPGTWAASYSNPNFIERRFVVSSHQLSHTQLYLHFFPQATHRFVNGIWILLFPTLSFTTIQGNLDISQIQQVLSLVVILLGSTAAQGVERAVTGERILAT